MSRRLLKPCESQHTDFVVKMTEEQIRFGNYVMFDIFSSSLPSSHFVHNATEISSNHNPAIVQDVLSRYRLYEATFRGFRCVTNSCVVAKAMACAEIPNTSHDMRVEAGMRCLVDMCTAICQDAEKQATEDNRCNECNVSIHHVGVYRDNIYRRGAESVSRKALEEDNVHHRQMKCQPNGSSKSD